MEFNWVKARSECSSKRVFEILYEVVESDVKIANELALGAKFYITSKHKKIIVTREGKNDEVRTIVFELSPTAISAREGQSEPMFAAKPRLSETGDCLFEVDGQLCQMWQICQKALEDLFFA